MNAEQDGGAPNRELYAVLQVSPESTTEEIRRAYRHWAQVYHPDKYQDVQMKETATENFQRICQAYEVLSDETKRQIYDIYGPEGLSAGLELATRTNKVEELKEELERLRQKKEEEKMAAQFIPSGIVVTSLSLPQVLDGDGIMSGMAMSSQVNTTLSKHTNLAMGGNLEVNNHGAGTAASTVLRHQLSSAQSIEFLAQVGLQSVIGVQTTRYVSSHSTATIGIRKSLQDGSINLSNTWTHQLSSTANGNIQFVLGDQSSVAVGWRKKDDKMSAGGELKVGTRYLGASAHYVHHFSSKSHARIAGKYNSTTLEVEVGGGRKISDLTTVRMMYVIGIQGISWRFETRRGSQKLVIPILLSTYFDPAFAIGAFVVPTSLYFLFEKFVAKPYLLWREKGKALENKQKTSAQVQEARISAEKSQQLLRIVANRKKTKQIEANGLLIDRAVYGSRKVLERQDGTIPNGSTTSEQAIDVTVPLNFLVNDSGQLKLHKGVKKSGIMGFCDPSPGEPKQLLVEYTYRGQKFKVIVDDYDELLIPQHAHLV
ncbi:unnamed protein product [Linum tenue]|uniref:J domain-containing protein n=1 Tax=Linum tenue TaxID=586396 RepID=A0AAV0Q3Y0_9ROSI|nr:unnamed protein product [Linum tenue]